MQRHSRWPAPAWLLVGLLLVSIAPAGAGARAPGPEQKRQEATTPLQRSRRLFERAEAHYLSGQLQAALALYRRAFRVTALAGFLFNIAQCHRRLGEWSRALAHYRAYLAALPRAPNRQQVRALIRLCEQRVAEEQAGHATRSRPRAGPATARRLAARTTALVPGADPQKLVGSDSPRGRPANKRPWVFAGVALSSTLALAGTVTGALALRDSDQYRQPRLDAAERAALRRRGERLATSATVTFALAGAVALGTAILYWLDRRDRARQRATVALAPLPSGGGVLAVADRF